MNFLRHLKFIETGLKSGLNLNEINTSEEFYLPLNEYESMVAGKT